MSNQIWNIEVRSAVYSELIIGVEQLNGQFLAAKKKGFKNMNIQVIFLKTTTYGDETNVVMQDLLERMVSSITNNIKSMYPDIVITSDVISR